MMVLVTGGASCGKSSFAEQVCAELGGDLVYLAAMRPFGEEGAMRVRKHRAQRAGKGFETVECYEGLKPVLDGGRLEGATALLECLGNVVANDLFDGDGAGAGTNVAERCAGIRSELDALSAQCKHLVVVGNEVGADGISYAAETRFYQEVLGAVSRSLADRCDFVVECAAGVAVLVKGFDAGLRRAEAAELARAVNREMRL